MSVILSCQNIAKSYYSRPLFHDVSFGIFEMDRMAIIGPNGSGKSTLLRLLAGLEQPDEGQVITRRQTRVGYIPQVQTFAPGSTVTEVLRQSVKNNPSQSHHSSDLEMEIIILLSRIGFENPDAKVSALSGGWKKRLGIACGILQEPDILLLDEPTNHLDFEGMFWLEEFLNSAPFAWAMVSHDRYFLNKTAKKVAELDSIYPTGIFISDGGYNDFLVKREEYIQEQTKREESLSNKVRRETEWLRRGPQARTTKSRSRIDEAHNMISELKSMRSRLSSSQAKIDFSATDRKTKRLIVVDSVRKQYGDKLILNDVNLVLTPNMSLGIIGGNGTGKTTLLKIISKAIQPDAGSVNHAEDLRVVYFDQEREQLDPSWTLKRALSDTGDSVIFQGRSIHVASWAKRFNLNAEHLQIPVSELSGGEQARVLIARLMLRPADVLILDEPTNDLDIATLDTLEESLQDFPGAIVLVTHDRYMLSRLCNIFIGFDGRGDHQLYADYEQWVKDLTRPFRAPKAAPANDQKEKDAPKSPMTKGNKRLSYMEQREYDGMEENIMVAEEELSQWQQKIEDPLVATSAMKLQEITSGLNKAQAKVDKLYSRWAELDKKHKDSI